MTSEMQPKQRRFLISLLLVGVVPAALFKFVIGPITAKAEREEQARVALLNEQRAQERKGAIDEAADITARARAKWRKEVLEAGASGALGTIPPLVTVRRNEVGDFVFTNVSGQPICFAVARIVLPARCTLGPVGTCQAMATGDEVEFDTTNRRNDPTCRSETLEFRIGNSVTSDLPWWSASALEDFDRVTALFETEFKRAQSGGGVGAVDGIESRQLKAESIEGEKFLADTTAADRWRTVITPLRQIQLDAMVAKQSGAVEEKPPVR
jgi:hypothetical protein